MGTQPTLRGLQTPVTRLVQPTCPVPTRISFCHVSPEIVLSFLVVAGAWPKAKWAQVTFPGIYFLAVVGFAETDFLGFALAFRGATRFPLVLLASCNNGQVFAAAQLTVMSWAKTKLACRVGAFRSIAE